MDDRNKSVKNNTLIYGKATTGKDQSEQFLAADVELVATGVARDASDSQLKEFIMSKGIEVLEISKLTTYEHAKTNTFKIKIKAAEYNKAMDPNNWPLRVGVRHYRQPRRDANGRQNWSDQSKVTGGFVDNQNQRNSMRQNHNNIGNNNHQANNNHYVNNNQQQSYRYPQNFGQPQNYQLPYPPISSPQYNFSYQQNGFDLQNRYVVSGFHSDVNC